ncbi:hypothetical protein Nepgr_016436 [Nepenthes gracilis]|uniref:Uncharacterized protein n=1 Tax=Nepenthes gracilis TaxID=150966 RepID=A0AAD3XSH6_NEPGR|nr:hypothetical protein Nepgr_016436 [Nepenthes gracilis]
MHFHQLAAGWHRTKDLVPFPLPLTAFGLVQNQALLPLQPVHNQLLNQPLQPSKKGGPLKSLSKIAPQYKPSGCSIPQGSVVNDLGGKRSRNFKSNSETLVKADGAVPDSNSFAALQSPEADSLQTLSEGSGKKDVSLPPKPDPGSNLGDEAANLECLPHSDKVLEPLGEFPLEIEAPGLARCSRIQGLSTYDTPLSKDAHLVEVPPGPSSTSISVAPRSSLMMAKRVPIDTSSHSVNLPHVLDEKEIEPPSLKQSSKKAKGPKKKKTPTPLYP